MNVRELIEQHPLPWSFYGGDTGSSDTRHEPGTPAFSPGISDADGDTVIEFVPGDMPYALRQEVDNAKREWQARYDLVMDDDEDRIMLSYEEPGYYMYEDWYTEEENKSVAFYQLVVTCVNAHYEEGIELLEMEVL